MLLHVRGRLIPSACLPVCLSISVAIKAYTLPSGDTCCCARCRVKRTCCLRQWVIRLRFFGANVLLAEYRRRGFQSSSGVAREQRFLSILFVWLNVVRCCPAGVLVRSFWRETFF